jgi:hypothetical protein
MANNRIWKIDYKTIRAHTDDQKSHTKLLHMAGSVLSNTYFKNERIVGWDIDLPIYNSKNAERILQTTLEVSDNTALECLNLRNFEGEQTKKPRYVIPAIDSLPEPFRAVNPVQVITQDSIIYRLIKHEKNVLIYSLSHTENPDNVIGYDVCVGHLPTQTEERTYFCYGKIAWSWTTLDAADNQFEELLGREPKNIPATISEMPKPIQPKKQKDLHYNNFSNLILVPADPDKSWRLRVYAGLRTI